MISHLKHVDLGQPWLIASVGTVLFNPIFWNIVARNEYKNKSLTKIFGSPYNGTVFLAITIFSLGIFRDWVYHKALLSQPASVGLENILVKLVGAGLFAIGQILVVTSIWALGLTGTYLGDYFGILMSHRVTSFPFNIMRDPMYNGSTLCFLGTALFYAKPAGLWISMLVWVVYQVALAFEGPFTDKIYSSAAAKKKREAAPVSASSGSDVGASSAGKTRTQSSTNINTQQQQQSTSTSTSSATATGSSYASAVHDHSHESRSTMPSTDPRPQVDLSHLGLGNPITNGYVGTGDPKAGAFEGLPEGSSPARVTRSRSRARIVDDD